MILYGSTMSPYARVARVVAREIGTAVRVQEVVADPWGDPAFRRINPLGKIPALVTDDGGVVYDSLVICEYLDSLDPKTRLYPKESQYRWHALTLRACAYGLMDAAYLRRNEAIRQQVVTISKTFIDRQDAAILAALDALEREAPFLASSLTIASLCAGTALGYLDFRYADCAWSTRCPALSTWWATLSSRPAFAETTHTDPPGVTPPVMRFALSLPERP